MKLLEEKVWTGCYQGTYDLISPDSFAHPAKMAPALCFKIIEHLEELGLLRQGMTILDPMGGTGLTAICANAKGYGAVTVELEERFIGFQRQNKEYAARKLGRPLDWEIMQGDSRRLTHILSGLGLVALTSPPYADAINAETKGGIDWNKCAEGPRPDKFKETASHGTFTLKYGTTEGNIGNLPDKPIVVTSPPYAEAQTGGGIAVNGYQGNKHSPTDLVGNRSYMPSTHGESVGQIGNLPDKPVTLTSPPYDGDVSASNSDPHPEKQMSKPAGRHYGDSDGQIGNTQSETYLSAMLQVYAEVAKVSDVIAVVTKNPTRNGKLRRLDLDTISLLEQTGWIILCVHEAQLFTEHKTQDLFGETHKNIKGRMSFFKRLSYQKGGIVADHEDVIIAVRNGGGKLVTVSSPPYEEQTASSGRMTSGSIPHDSSGHFYKQDYGNTSGQIGKLK